MWHCLRKTVHHLPCLEVFSSVKQQIFKVGVKLVEFYNLFDNILNIHTDLKVKCFLGWEAYCDRYLPEFGYQESLITSNGAFPRTVKVFDCCIE